MSIVENEFDWAELVEWRRDARRLARAARLLKVTSEEVPARVAALLARLEEIESELRRTREHARW